MQWSAKDGHLQYSQLRHQQTVRLNCPSLQDTMSSAAHDEEVYVHQVYDSIASHFSDTRYKVLLRLSAAICSTDLVLISNPRTAMAFDRQLSRKLSVWISGLGRRHWQWQMSIPSNLLFGLLCMLILLFEKTWERAPSLQRHPLKSLPQA